MSTHSDLSKALRAQADPPAGQSGSDSQISNLKSAIPKGLTPTHTFADDPVIQVAAWQYDPVAPRPVWVCRLFHKLDSSQALTAIARDGQLVTALESDWIVAFALDCGTDQWTAIVLSPDEFNRCFSKLP